MGDTIHPLRSRDVPTVDQFGPIFMGIVANYFLWGVQVVQTYYYYKTFRGNDRMWLKTAVVLLFIVDGFQTICSTQGAWKILVANWGDLENVNFMGWGLIMIPMMDALTSSIVHVFYMQKIWNLLDPPYKYFWTLVIFLCSCGELTAGMGISIFETTIHITFSTFNRVELWSTLWFLFSAVADVTIAALMTWKLSKSRSANKETNEIISKTIQLIIETGVATSVIQVLCVILQRTFPLKSYVMFPGVLSAKLYSNSMMALLNSRRPRTTQLDWRSKAYNQGESVQLDTAAEAPGNKEYSLEGTLGDKVVESLTPSAKPRSPEGEGIDELCFHPPQMSITVPGSTSTQ